MLGFEGLTGLRLDEQGNLVLQTAGGEILQQRPIVYQEAEGVRHELFGGYVLKAKNQIAFEVGAYDPDRPLVIDPVLLYSTYLGGSELDEGFGVAADALGNAYVTGFTFSPDFPTASPLQPEQEGVLADAFITKVSADGSTLLYSTYLGGGGADVGYAIALDADGNAYVGGSTASFDFPTVNPVQDVLKGGTFGRDGFVTKLNVSGSAIVFSTYLGGGENDQVRGLAVDALGDVYAAGHTRSPDFPTTVAAFDTTHGGGNCQAGRGPCNDAFVSRLDLSSATLVYSTFLGGGGDVLGEDFAEDIAVDADGNAYVTGFTNSAEDFPTVNPIQASNGGFPDAFVTKVNPSGTALVYSTYLGGPGNERGFGIAVDADGNAYVAGTTSLSGFPTANPIQATSGGGGTDAFVTKVNAAGTALVYSTYLGGDGTDVGLAIAIDSEGNAFVTGFTASTNLPMASPPQAKEGVAKVPF